MRLDLVSLAHVARRAGMHGPMVPVAASVAMASSGGLTEYEHRAGAPGAGRWRGLWAIDVDRYPQYATVDLHDPATAATAVLELTQASRGWGWSVPYRTGLWRAWHAQAGTEASKVTVAQKVERPTYLGAYGLAFGDTLSELARIADNARSRTTKGH